MRTRVQKWGNSLGVRIPRSFAEEVGLDTNSPVDLSLRNGKLVLAPAARPKLALRRLLSRITGKNLHQEVDTGPATGKERW